MSEYCVLCGRQISPRPATDGMDKPPLVIRFRALTPEQPGLASRARADQPICVECGINGVLRSICQQ